LGYHSLKLFYKFDNIFNSLGDIYENYEYFFESHIDISQEKFNNIKKYIKEYIIDMEDIIKKKNSLIIYYNIYVKINNESLIDKNILSIINIELNNDSIIKNDTKMELIKLENLENFEKLQELQELQELQNNNNYEYVKDIINKIIQKLKDIY
jgi:hypothetical protein